jgi:hypothetical protein
MSKEIAEAVLASCTGNYSLFKKFLSTCPDDVWAASFGGWPIWQQVAHTIYVNTVFIPKDFPAGTLPDLSQELFQLKEKGTEPVPREFLLNSWEVVRKLTFEHLESLQDSDLPKTAIVRNGRELSTLKVVSLLTGHIMYHLGVFDSALRERGLPGIV